VVVEEGPAKATSRKSSRLVQSTIPGNEIQAPQTSPDSVDESAEDNESEEDETSEDEDDHFDINDSSPEAAAPLSTVENRQTPEEEALAMEKARELEGGATPEAAALALHEGNAYMRSVKSKARSRSRERSRFRSHSSSGVDTPGRFAGPTPHPPHIAPRHVEFTDLLPLSPAKSSDSLEPVHPAQHGSRDDINTQKSVHSGRSRIPRDRDVDAESMNMKTPTVADLMHGGKRVHHRGHSPEQQHHHHRAFAVWGQDESDSNASDSDA
jgi:NAD+ kinase